MRIETVSEVRLNSSPAVEAFLFDFDRIRDAYEYDWRQQASYERRAAWLHGGGYRGDRAALVAALTAYNRAVGSGAATAESLDQLRQPETLAVVTGQQAGIFTGPAYSVYKAITAIRLARRQSGRLGVPVVPVFWVAAEDHDWREVSWVLAPSGEGMTRLALKEPLDGDRRSVGLAPMPESVRTHLLAELEALLPDSEFKPGVMARIRSAVEGPPALDPILTGGKPTLVDGFARLIAWLFEGTGLIIVNPSDPALRQLEAQFFATVIDRHEAVDAALGRGEERWRAMGYTPTVERQLGNVNLFTYIGDERLPLVGAGEHFWIRDREDIGWDKAELVGRALERPQLFSTNVVLRPVVQGVLFPDLAYVGGPGEIAYFGLYRDVFAALDRQMPVVYPRESFSLVEPPVARIMEKQGLTLADALFRLEERRQEVLEREDRLGLGSLFAEFRGDFDSKYAALVEKLLLLDPSLRFVADENRKQITVQVNKLEEKARQQHRKNCEVSLRQFDRIRANLAPDGLQERSVSILPYLAKYGPDLVARLLAEAPFEEGWAHRAVYL